MTQFFNKKTSYLTLAACLISVSSVHAQMQPSHDHGHTEHGAMQLELNHGQPWSTDAPLREGMQNIRVAVTEAQQANKQDHLDATQVQTLVTAIEDNTLFMVQNCSLEPKADANLHILLGRLSAAATAIKADSKSVNGLPEILEVLDIYPRYFSHPGWQVTAHSH